MSKAFLLAFCVACCMLSVMGQPILLTNIPTLSIRLAFDIASLNFQYTPFVTTTGINQVCTDASMGVSYFHTSAKTLWNTEKNEAQADTQVLLSKFKNPFDMAMISAFVTYNPSNLKNLVSYTLLIQTSGNVALTCDFTANSSLLDRVATFPCNMNGNNISISAFTTTAF